MIGFIGATLLALAPPKAFPKRLPLRVVPEVSMMLKKGLNSRKNFSNIW
jgi:hypothetical protein